jgi:hypothetical protein
MNRLLYLAILSFILCRDACSQSSAKPDFLPDFHATVEFHYRVLFPDTNQGGKIVAAPGIKRENLPSTQLLPAKKSRVLQGKVRDLSLVFYVRLTRPDPAAPLFLEVNVIDPTTNRSIQGFPTQQSINEGVAEFHLSLSDEENRRATGVIKNDPLALLAYVNLVVSLDALSK